MKKNKEVFTFRRLGRSSSEGTNGSRRCRRRRDGARSDARDVRRRGNMVRTKRRARTHGAHNSNNNNYGLRNTGPALTFEPPPVHPSARPPGPQATRPPVRPSTRSAESLFVPPGPVVER